MNNRFNKDQRSSRKNSINRVKNTKSFRSHSDKRKSEFDRSSSNYLQNQQFSTDEDTNDLRNKYQPNYRIRNNNNRTSDFNRLSNNPPTKSRNNINSYESKNDKRIINRRGEYSDNTYSNAKRDSLNPAFNEEHNLRAHNESFSNSPPADLLWGRHTTEAALLAGRPIHRIWCTSEIRSTPKFFQLLRDSKATGVLVEEVSWSRLGQITKGAVHQGIVLQTAASKTLELTSLIKACKSLGDSALLLAIDGLTDPHNLGAIIRSAEALGAHGMVLPQRRSAGLTGSVAKVAAGALEHLPVARVVNLNRSLEKLKDSGYTVIGLAEEGDVTLPEIELDGPIVIVTGSEDKGISLLTRKLCDSLVRIPLRGVTPSLNASVATSICLYEVARKRWMRTLSGQAPSPRTVKPQFINEKSSE